jgi:hypothetical protein
MTKPPAASHPASLATPAALATNVAIALNAVLAAVDNERPKVLCVQADALGLPYGPFDPARHRTFEIGMREWVERQTKISLGFIEQLYTFGDEGREAPAAALAGAKASERIVSVGYLALAPALSQTIAEGAVWRDWYGFFPWEDWRDGEPEILRERIIPGLTAWAGSGRNKSSRKARINIAFGQGGMGWAEERTLDRYELMYEAGLVVEAGRDRAAAGLDSASSATKAAPETGAPMLSDHRRILATAIGRLRGKLKYRPVIFEMTPPEFTLLQLQRTVEAIVGFGFHKQNFRRTIEKSGFVEPTGEATQEAGGRPAALFRINREGLRERAATGLAIPRLRRSKD